jgi:hypothetical protein
MSKRSTKPQKDLPGMEDRQIPELHQKLILLDAVRKQRMKLTTRETELNEECRLLMEKNKKKESGYDIDGVHAEYKLKDPKVVISVKVDPDAALDETKPGEVQHVSPQDGADFDDQELAVH